MPNRLSPTALSLTALLAATACSDGTTASTPVAPPGRPAPLGIIRGTVSGDSMRAEFIPMGASAAINSAVSPSIYGGPATVAVTGTFVSLVDNPPTNRTWTFKVHMQNLLTYPIGSNYSATNPAPPDTSGVFIVFTSLPVVNQLPACPHGCSVSVANYAGKGAFTGLNQPYFWYKDRPTAVQGSPDTDTTSDALWNFTGTFNALAGDTAHSFTFVLMVSAAWPPSYDTAWAYSYSGKTDSLPDKFAKPRWKTPFAQTNGYTAVGTETFNMGTDLVLSAPTSNSAVYIARNDSMDSPKSASIAVVGHLQSTIAGAPLQAMFGIVQPGASGKQAIVGIYEDHIAFMHLDPVTGLWSDIPGETTPVDATANHVYRIRKFGTLDMHLCIDSDALVDITPAQLDATAPDFSTTTVVFGALGNATAAANFHVTSVTYVLGTDGGGC